MKNILAHVLYDMPVQFSIALKLPAVILLTELLLIPNYLY